MAYPPPKIVGHGAERMRLVCFVRLAPGQRVTAGLSTAGPGPRETAGLAVCEYAKDEYYLFTCDDGWSVMFDTCHRTVDEALQQAEYEHTGIMSQWVYPKTRAK